MIAKVSFNELLDAYGIDQNGNVVNGIDPVAYIDDDNNIFMVDIFTLKGHYNFVVDTTDTDPLVYAYEDEGDCDYWDAFGVDVDINIYSRDGGMVSVSFYPVVDGDVDTADTRLEGISCFVERLKAKV